MPNPEGYQPTEEDIFLAEETMNDKQQLMSEVREESINEGKEIGGEELAKLKELKALESSNIGQILYEINEVKNFLHETEMGTAEDLNAQLMFFDQTNLDRFHEKIRRLDERIQRQNNLRKEIRDIEGI